ncbi:3-mercaptopyruvate sulfurtransferase [Sphingomonas sp. MAH-20]|uniref:Sulfurtransferase n=1 Tax=Sphingomonas horti TaxID=2682842 RepID=A0A6I4J403_9SPHN|nr:MULTISPECIES: 3-mercaptopyruvate sulfurtransferase [Sphingomonas]MBA2919014.1 3-mercaptopyruvate sulfurtransferase [Sphingomonas sp. CGMCC 1.13658]MVO79047.1 3-mercaptopyruvate sulfurtransferase [Sphingomonas horti]
MDALVSTDWLEKELGAVDLRVVDATWLMPGEGDAAAAFEQAHIPGAVFMDLAELADSSTSLPNMLPPAEKFASRMQSLGLGDGSRIVVYDQSPYKTAARAWWMLRTFGAHDVAILDGGLAKWRAESRPVESGKPQVRHRHFTAWTDSKSVRSLDQMKANVGSRAEQVLDARGADRFAGQVAERPGVQPGHIPGSRNLPYTQLFNADGSWKQGDDLRQAFERSGVDLDKPIVTTCGSGITASVLLFGLHLLGKDAALYDGSWSEWGADPSTPKETGAAA